MTAPVFFIPADDAARLAPGLRYRLGGDEGRHAATVRRLQRGEAVELIDGRGTRIAATVAAVGQPELTVIGQQITHEPQPEPRIVLVQALAKDRRDVQAIEAAVECGVDAVIPWAADRSIVQWRGPKADQGRLKWVNAVRAATKQARRAWLPPVAPVIDSRHLAKQISEVTGAGGAALVLHEGAVKPLADAQLPTRGDVLVIVGPEGGISAAELAAFADADADANANDGANAQAVRLGPHIMRSSTAGPVAVAMLAQRLGRWDDPPAR